MMGTKMLKQLRDAISTLNPHDVREAANRPVSVELVASTPAMYDEMERFFIPPGLSDAKRQQSQGVVFRATEGRPAGIVQIYYEGLPHGPEAFTFYRTEPHRTIEEILDARDDLSIALARRVPAFRDPVVARTTWNVSRENALFSLATAVPSIVPFLSLPWAVGEFASDTAFLTMNQIRMAFLIAAASDRTVGYKEQRTEIASLFAGAFGWRALARELIGKIPMGGGLVPKAAISFAGTYVVGLSLDRYYRLGRGYTKEERKSAYDSALEKGKAIASSLLDNYRNRNQPVGTTSAR